MILKTDASPERIIFSHPGLFYSAIETAHFSSRNTYDSLFFYKLEKKRIEKYAV